MANLSPKENVYYYECSGGEFRLVYFIPPAELQELDEQDRISPRVLEDFPDGVDLSCTEHDFEEFHELYGYRPAIAPDALRRAFFALFSSTDGWRDFRGSGLVPAAEIEQRVEMVEGSLRTEGILPEESEPLREALSPEERRRRTKQQSAQQSRVYSYLEQMEVEGIDPGQTLRYQEFSPIEMQEDRTAKEVFEGLHRKRKGQ